MRNILKLIFKQAFSFLLIILIGKVLFVGYHSSKFFDLNEADRIGVFKHGFALDLSITAYLLVIPIILILLVNIFKKSKEIFLKINKYYHLIICLLISCIVVLDIELFRTWHIRIDASPLKYLSNPSEMLASVGASPFGILILIFLFLLIVSIILNYLIFKAKYEFSTKNKILETALLLLFLASLIIPIRGGFQLAPINQSSAYFSNNNFANQAAVNPVYNLFHSLTHKSTGENPFVFKQKAEAEKLVENLFYEDKSTDYQIVNGKPNVLLITWESLTSKVLNQKMEVTPNLKKLINEGIYFENCYASGDRSDKGMVAILSGYPAQPITSIINLPQKTAKLPIISKTLKRNSYSTAWYYGGEPEFANIKSYILTGQFYDLVTKEDFPKQDTENTKWGANDAVVFNRLFSDLNKMKEPFFVNYFTLSSHEPFEIPNHNIIKGNDETSKFLNAHHFTDDQLGKFIENAKKQSWYKNTLIVVTADHGHRLPLTNAKKDEFHIPLLFFGGALKHKPMIVSDIVSQNDISKSILKQLQFETDEFVWSKNLFSKSKRQSAYFCFNNGFGFVQPNKWFAFDNNTMQIIEKKGPVYEADIVLGKSFQQTSFADYLAK
jgi:phosphoglycerol transferase MdoB-like AlkP superfamily enzyme